MSDFKSNGDMDMVTNQYALNFHRWGPKNTQLNIDAKIINNPSPSHGWPTFKNTMIVWNIDTMIEIL